MSSNDLYFENKGPKQYLNFYTITKTTSKNFNGFIGPKNGQEKGKFCAKKRLFSFKIIKRALSEGQNLILNTDFGSRLSTFRAQNTHKK